MSEEVIIFIMLGYVVVAFLAILLNCAIYQESYYMKFEIGKAVVMGVVWPIELILLIVVFIIYIYKYTIEMAKDFKNIIKRG